jgi:hypothetical protein
VRTEVRFYSQSVYFILDLRIPPSSLLSFFLSLLSALAGPQLPKLRFAPPQGACPKMGNSAPRAIQNVPQVHNVLLRMCCEVFQCVPDPPIPSPSLLYYVYEQNITSSLHYFCKSE